MGKTKVFGPRDLETILLNPSSASPEDLAAAIQATITAEAPQGGGGTGTPGGVANSVQTNDGAGGLTGDANFTYDGTTVATNALVANQSISVGDGFFQASDSGVFTDIGLVDNNESSLALDVVNRNLVAPDGESISLTWSTPNAVVVNATLAANQGLALGDGEVRQTLWLADFGDYNHAIFNNESLASTYDYSALPGTIDANNDGEVFTYMNFLAFQGRDGSGTLSYFDTGGSFHLGGALNAGGFAITNVIDPANPQDAATKNYTDTQIASKQGALIYDRVLPTDGDTHTIPNGAQACVINQNLSGDLANYTLVLPAIPADGQEMLIVWNRSITTLIVNPNAGQTVAQAIPSGLSSYLGLFYDGTDQIWFVTGRN